MALAKKTYTDLVTVIPADNLNDIQDSIIALENSKTADEVIIANLRTDVDENTASIGSLSDLTTESKTDLVSAINEAASSGGGLTEDVKVALLDCFEHVAWIDEHGQDYVDALEEALYPPANLVSISAVYTQSGTVYDTDSLDSLKSDLVVTAHYSDASTAVVTTYLLSGTLAEGTSTITVSYGGKTTTFSVNVTQEWDYVWEYDGVSTPTNMTYVSSGSGNDTALQAFVAKAPNLDFNHIGDCELVANMRIASSTTEPALILKGLNRAFKIRPEANTSNYFCNYDGALNQKYANDGEFHEFKMKLKNEICYMYVDNNLIGNGSGSTNLSAYAYTGFFTDSSVAQAFIYIKSIRFRSL